MTRHVPASQVLPLLDRLATTGHQEVLDVVLHQGDTSWNPASTQVSIEGPATVVYRSHPDGGIDATVKRSSKVS